MNVVVFKEITKAKVAESKLLNLTIKVNLQSKHATRKGSCIDSESRLEVPRDNLNELVRKNRSGLIVRHSFLLIL